MIERKVLPVRRIESNFSVLPNVTGHLSGRTRTAAELHPLFVAMLQLMSTNKHPLTWRLREEEKMLLSLCGGCSRMLRLRGVASRRRGSGGKYASRSLWNYGARSGTRSYLRYARLLMFPRFLLASARLRESTGVWREDVVVLGVETSCDDTGVAVIRGDGHVMGEALQSQTEVHKT